MKDFRNAGAVIAILFKVLSPTVLVCTDFFASAGVPGCLAGIGVIPKHEGRPRGTAESGLAIGAREPRALGGQLVDIRCLAEFVPVTTQSSSSEVVRDDEENVGLVPGTKRISGQEDEEREGTKGHPSRFSWFSTRLGIL